MSSTSSTSDSISTTSTSVGRDSTPGPVTSATTVPAGAPVGSAGRSVFSRIIDGDVPGRFVWADEVCVAFATVEPHTDGHVLVVPRQEIDSYVQAPDETVAHLAVVARRIGAAQARVFGAPRAGLVVAGYGVNHLHLHVLPIRSESDLSFSSARSDVPGEELDAAMERLRDGLREDGWSAFVPLSLNSAALPGDPGGSGQSR